MPETRKKTILLVEDEAFIAILEQTHLQELGYSVILANTGEKAIEIVNARNEPIDLITLPQWLSKKGLIEKVGGLDYLVSLADAVSTSAGIRYHAQIIRDLHRLDGGFEGADDPAVQQVWQWIRQDPWDQHYQHHWRPLVDELRSPRNPP